MKFPLASPPFRSLHLSSQQCAAYQQFADRLVNEITGEYERFVRHQHRVLDPKEWKAVKSREHVTVYKQRDGTSSLPKSSQPNGSSSPPLLAVGTIVGNLDDVLYGVVTPNADTVKIKTQYVHDEIVDSGELFSILSPTEHDPFQSLAVKWVVKTHATSVAAMVRPRDTVCIEATGYARLPNGHRIGYHIVQSVDLPDCPALTHLGILRCQASSISLFRPRDDGATVEVYMKSHVDLGGDVPDFVAVTSSTNVLIGCWKVVWCAQNKKLAWMLRDAAAIRARAQQFQDSSTKIVVHANADGKRCCGMCTKTLPRLRRVVACELCRTAVCSRCRTARTLAYVRPLGDVVTKPTTFCKNCITRASHARAADVARFEYVPDALDKRRDRTRSEDVKGAVHPRPVGRRGSITQPLERVVEPSAKVSSVSSLESLDAEESEEVHVETIDEWEREHSMDLRGATKDTVEKAIAATATPSPTEVPTPRTDPLAASQHEMWKQMHELYAKVEQTYQLTKATNTNLL